MQPRNSDKVIAGDLRTAFAVSTSAPASWWLRLRRGLLVVCSALLVLVWLRPSLIGIALTLSAETATGWSAYTQDEPGAGDHAKSVLDCFQVAVPVLATDAASRSSVEAHEHAGTSFREPCVTIMMDHVFAFSYGKPYIGQYTPPSCEFNRVILNFTVVSEGRQFDRLALMYFGDTEVWRTSTAEPTTSPGIRWMYLKDMTEYLYFWKTPQTLIFDLGNLVDDKYTGTFNTTLTATFLTSPLPADTPAPADLIIPISARNGAANKTSAFVLPADNATNTIAFPQNVNRAVFSVSANGQASEEFWWSNVLQSDVDTFHSTAGRLPGLSPFREVQVLIDGQLAGVWWPFPVVFTGGVVPSLHRPIVGLDAFDLREHEIDVSPWLSVLCDGNEHSFTILVAGLDDSIGQELALTKAVNSNWVITGKLFLWLDDKDSVTTGTPPIFNISQPQFKVARVLTNDSSGHNDTLAFTVSVERTIAVRADIKSQHRSGQASWSQFLTYSNKAGVTNSGYNQINDFLISGVDIAAGPGVYYRTNYDYPLFCNSTTLIDPVQGNLTIGGHLIQGLSLGIEGTSIFPNGLESFLQEPRGEMATFYGSLLKTSRDGIAWFFQTGDKKKASGFGSTKQVFNFSGIPALSSSRDTEGIQLYFRNVTAANGTVVYDSEPHSSRHLGQPDFGTAAGKETHLAAPQEWFAETPVVGAGPRAFMYRGHIADRAA